MCSLKHWVLALATYAESMPRTISVEFSIYSLISKHNFSLINCKISNQSVSPDETDLVFFKNLNFTLFKTTSPEKNLVIKKKCYAKNFGLWWAINICRFLQLPPAPFLLTFLIFNLICLQPLSCALAGMKRSLGLANVWALSFNQH